MKIHGGVMVLKIDHEKREGNAISPYRWYGILFLESNWRKLVYRRYSLLDQWCNVGENTSNGKIRDLPVPPFVYQIAATWCLRCVPERTNVTSGPLLSQPGNGWYKTSANIFASSSRSDNQRHTHSCKIKKFLHFCVLNKKGPFKNLFRFRFPQISFSIIF